jgi:hypothetical protein
MTVGKPIVDQVSDSFSRPADTTSYSNQDLVANDVDAGDVNPLEFDISTGQGRGIRIVGARLQKSGTTTTNATFSLHLYTQEPTMGGGDNATFSTDASGFVGSITFPTMTAFTDDALAIVHTGPQSGGVNPLHTYLRAGSTLYGLLRAEAAYAPASAETFTATLTIEQY